MFEGVHTHVGTGIIIKVKLPLFVELNTAGIYTYRITCPAKSLPVLILIYLKVYF